MSEAVRDLFDRWERVWHEGQYDLIPSCVGSHYIRHDEKGDRTVTREPTRRNWLISIGSDRAPVSSCTITHSQMTARGFVSRSCGLILRLASAAAERGCKAIGSRAASSPRPGLRCSH